MFSCIQALRVSKSRCFFWVLSTVPLIGCLSFNKMLFGAEPQEVFNVWRDGPPTATRISGPEQILENRPRPFYQLTNISTPTVSVFLPPREKRLGAAILVCPGGGLQRLAIEHEGFEVAQWLNEKGISAFVLKYRVPAPVNIGLQDAQRAMCLIRSRAADWNVDPDCIGAIGFSAGAEICAWLATHDSELQYPKRDAYDDASTRPTFVGLVYAGGLVSMRGGVNERIASKLSSKTPPMFITHALPDASLNSLEMAVALKRAGSPAEIHVYQEGAHGFGVRSTGQPLDAWREAFMKWCRANGYLDPSSVRSLEKTYLANAQSDTHDHSSNLANPIDLDEAYAVQRRIVRRKLDSDKIWGYRNVTSNMKSTNSQSDSKIAFSTLLASQVIASSDELVRHGVGTAPTLLKQSRLEFGLGFVVGTDIAVHVSTAEQAKASIEKIAPIIAWTPNNHGEVDIATQTDLVARNFGSSRIAIGPSKSAKDLDLAKLEPRVRRSEIDVPLGSIQKLDASAWTKLHLLMNEIVDRGNTIPASGMLFVPFSVTNGSSTNGNYVAEFGPLGSLEFVMP